MLTIAEQRSQQLVRCLVTSLAKQPLSCFAPPGVGAFQVRDKLGGCGGTELRLRASAKRWRCKAINPTTIIAATQVEFCLDVIRDRPWMLDGLAVHIQNMQSTVRRVDKVDWSEPRVARGDELRGLV